jgi:hypothetical protein
MVIHGPWKHEELHELQVIRRLPVEEMSNDGAWFTAGNTKATNEARLRMMQYYRPWRGYHFQ